MAKCLLFPTPQVFEYIIMLQGVGFCLHKITLINSRSSVQLWCKMLLSLLSIIILSQGLSKISPGLPLNLIQHFQCTANILVRYVKKKTLKLGSLADGREDYTEQKDWCGKINFRYTRPIQAACAEYSCHCSVCFVIVSAIQQRNKPLQKVVLASKMLCLQSHRTRSLEALVQKAPINDISGGGGQNDVFHSHF